MYNSYVIRTDNFYPILQYMVMQFFVVRNTYSTAMSGAGASLLASAKRTRRTKGDRHLESEVNVESSNTAPRPVSRGASLHAGFLGIDSLYLVLEYPRRDVFDFWLSAVGSLDNQDLWDGIVFEDFVIKKGAQGYQLAIWQGDARLFITDRVTETLAMTAQPKQGMGVMLQLGPTWLRAYGDQSYLSLIENVLAQFKVFLIADPENYFCRLNRLDIALDVIGLQVASFSVDDWRNGWVGYAHKKHFYDSTSSGGLEGFAVGTSSGTVRFKVYDKVAESQKRNSNGFWRSVWGLDENDPRDVARFEWSIFPFKGHFGGLRYLTDLSLETLLDLLNYVSLKWGRLCIPQADQNKARWELAPLWIEVRRMIEEWSFNYQGVAKRSYDYRPDLNEGYINSVSGWIAGFMARVGIEHGSESPADVADALKLLNSNYKSLSDKAQEKMAVLSRLIGGRNDAE